MRQYKHVFKLKNLLISSTSWLF